MTYEYDPATGRRKGITYSNGASVAYTYDWRGNTASITHKNATGYKLLTLDYTLDDDGLIVAIDEERRDNSDTVTSDVRWDY